ncbi:MAG: hypothetical protein ACK41Q_02030 [Candidatus Brocadia sp.]
MAAADQEKSPILPNDARHAKDWDRFIAVKRLVQGQGVAAALRAKPVIQRAG